MHITVSAPAKINLFLDITGRRNDGYHLINTVMQTITLCDDVTVNVDPDGSEISVSCTNSSIPCDSSNTAYRAAQEFFSAAGIPVQGVSIKIKKRIPFGAGMAGGSTDAAAVLFALNELLDTDMTTDELAEIGEKIGADVPFCVYGGTMTGTGTGTILSPLPDMPQCHIVVVKPDISISTAEAYRRSDEYGYESIHQSDLVVNGICNGNVRSVAEGLYNKFEDVTGNEEIEHIKEEMLSQGAVGSIMTGSGSAVFAIFDDEDKADDCVSHIKGKYDQVFLAKPCKNGPKEIQGRLFSIFSDN